MNVRAHTSCPEHDTGAGCVSSGTGSGARSGAKAGNSSGKVAGCIRHRVFDPYRERARFPERWAEWCQANFRNSVELANAFMVSEKTARLWMQGVTAPQGWAVEPAKDGLVRVVRNGRLEPVPPFGAKAA